MIHDSDWTHTYIHVHVWDFVFLLYTEDVVSMVVVPCMKHTVVFLLLQQPYNSVSNMVHVMTNRTMGRLCSLTCIKPITARHIVLVAVATPVCGSLSLH